MALSNYKKFNKLYKKEVTWAKREVVGSFIATSSNVTKAAWRVIRDETGHSEFNDVNIAPEKFNNFFMT